MGVSVAADCSVGMGVGVYTSGHGASLTVSLRSDGLWLMRSISRSPSLHGRSHTVHDSFPEDVVACDVEMGHVRARRQGTLGSQEPIVIDGEHILVLTR